MYKQIFEKYLENYHFPELFSKEIKYVLAGGQRIRPQLLLSWNELCGGRKEEALPAALAIELLHTASLIQDDLSCMDNEEMRRGKAALHKIVGEAKAILLSNILIGLSFTLVSELTTSAENKESIIKIIFETITEMCRGQILELSGATSSEEERLIIYKGKTASLLSAACEIGAILANSSPEDRIEAKEYGYHLGIGYQLADDLQDNDGITAILSQNEIEKILQSYLLKIQINQDNETAIFLNKITQKALLRN